ncbi:sensor histidine kinase [Pseudobutyrivibrio sp.]|uniref:sensor histidine kinase n=1 Tax=Pseudobutyrivibrio sp. TaxID=2014367 RepID=UPI001D33AE97|nr:ATP-binding protein [Pseudobutyrivibrio sp.]MBE5909672.1 sensor histidine kinase [Pseudobutyrivibrio sp.]
MTDFLAGPYSLLFVGNIVAIYIYYLFHKNFYKKRDFFEKNWFCLLVIYVFSVVGFFYLNTFGHTVLNMIAAFAFYFLPLFIGYKVNNIRGIVYFIFYIAMQGALEIGIALAMEDMGQIDSYNMDYAWMVPTGTGVTLLVQFIFAKGMCYFGNKEKDRRFDKVALAYVVLPFVTIIFYCFTGVEYINNGDSFILTEYTKMIVILILFNLFVFALLEKFTDLLKKEIILKQNEIKLQSDAEIMALATKNMKERLTSSEEVIEQDRKMRHDRRHFEALLLSLLQEGNIEKAKSCLEDRMAIEPRSIKKYCDNATINASLTHYVSLAELNNIKITVSTNIPRELEMDELQLAIVISNLLENAIHACENLDENDRFIEVTAKYKSQLLLEIVNSCDGVVPLNEDGYPFSNMSNHGIGTRSVLAFIQETDSDIKYISENGVFKVRMVI